MTARERNWTSAEEKDEYALRAARLRVVEGKTLEQIRALLDFSHVSQVSRLVSYARERGFFSVQIPNRDRQISIVRDDDLESRLVERFGLKGAIVVKLDQSSFASEDAHVRDDRLHYWLGVALADVLRNLLSMDLPSGIGLGGGRGPYYCASALSRTPMRRSSVRIYSLTGAMSTPVWDESDDSDERYLLLDARDVTNLLAKALRASVDNLYRLNVPLAHESSDDKKRLLRKQASYLGTEGWEDGGPEMAIVGIGALDGGHRMLRLEDEDFELGVIKNDLELVTENSNRFRDIMKSRLDRDYCPVGDLCNFLFYIPPANLVERSLPDEAVKCEQLIKKKIAEINEKLLTIHVDQLREIKTVIAVAGGVYKHHAIHAVLTDGIYYGPSLGDEVPNTNKRLVDILCTDTETAQTILRL